MINVKRLTTAEAARRLGVKPQTLYAYVSRGLLHSQRGPGGSTFDRAEVERLAATRPGGEPSPRLVFPSAVTLIDRGRLYYRGVDALEAAENRSFEAVAEWLWHGAWLEEFPWTAPTEVLDAVVAAQQPLPPTSLPIDRLRVIVAVAVTFDPFRFDTSPNAAVATGRRLLRLMVDGLPSVPRSGRRARRPTGGDGSPVDDRPGWFADRVWPRLTGRAPSIGWVRALDNALVLLADHELAAATLAARVAAAFRADPYAVVGTGLNALAGPGHGGASLAVEALLRDAATDGPAAAIGERLRRGERLPGFGQIVYPDGDPRASYLLGVLRRAQPPARAWRVVQELLDATDGREVPPPNVDFALAALAFCAGMIPGAGEAIFALARTAGWIAHALEQYDDDAVFRARARYIGDPPGQPS